MAHLAMTMTAHGVSAEKCAGCFRPFERAEVMYAMQYEDGEYAGWHCDGCRQLWIAKGESALPRWEKE